MVSAQQQRVLSSIPLRCNQVRRPAVLNYSMENLSGRLHPTGHGYPPCRNHGKYCLEKELSVFQDKEDTGSLSKPFRDQGVSDGPAPRPELSVRPLAVLSD